MAERISSNAPMTPADHWLAQALTVNLCRVTRERDARAEMMRDELARAWRASDSRNSHVRRLAAAAGALVGARPGSAAEVRALMEAGDALAEFAEWRLGLALAQLGAREVAA